MALTQQSAHRKDAGKIADMQHRHFATIATIIARMDVAPLTRACEPEEARAEIARQFAIELSSTNPKFDRARFLRACKP